MNTKTFSTGPLIIVAIAMTVAASLFGATMAHAATAPTIVTTILNASNATTSLELVGSVVHATAMVASSTGSTTPSGSVNFKLYMTQNCTGASTTQLGVGLVSGIAVSATTIVPAGGLSYFAQYGGDINYPAADGVCQSLAATSTTPTSTPSTISGTVFNDQNNNGVKDMSDPGLSGWTVWLHQGANMSNSPVIATATTDANGNYYFWNLAIGSYFVEEQEQTGWNQTTSDMAVVIDSVHLLGNVNFANVMKGSGTATSTDNGNGHHGSNNDWGHDSATSTDQGHDKDSGGNHNADGNQHSNHDGSANSGNNSSQHTNSDSRHSDNGGGRGGGGRGNH